MTMNISRRTALKTAAAAGALSVTGMPAMAAPKHGGTYTIGMSGGNTSDTWDSRTHSDSFMINMGAGCVFETLHPTHRGSRAETRLTVYRASCVLPVHRDF